MQISSSTQELLDEIIGNSSFENGAQEEDQVDRDEFGLGVSDSTQELLAQLELNGFGQVNPGDS